MSLLNPNPAKPKLTYMYKGMYRDWLAFCFIGDISLFFGNLWLSKDMIMVGSAIQFVFLPPWTAAIIYLTYNSYGNVFTTWWYASLTVVQFSVGLMSIFLYAWVKSDLETRAREEHIKCDIGKLTFPR